MDNEKTFEEKIADLKTVKDGYQFNPSIVAPESVDQLIKAHELKYIENILEVDEENKLVRDNLDDFFDYPEEIQKAALAAYEHTKRDPEYFTRPGIDQGLYKPCIILTNIDNKKNEAKIKTWKVEYHARLISRLGEFRFFAGKKLVKDQPSIISLIVNLFSRVKDEYDDHGHLISK